MSSDFTPPARRPGQPRPPAPQRPPAQQGPSSPQEPKSSGGGLADSLSRGFASYWRWTTGGSKWRWAPSIVAGFFAFIIFMGIAFPSEEEEPGSQSSAGDQPAAVTTSDAPAAVPTNPPAPTAAVALTFEQRIEKSYRDNMGFMPRATADGLKVEWAPATGDLTIKLQTTKLLSEGDALTVGGHSAIVANRAVWTTYPEVMFISVQLFTDFTDINGQTAPSVAASSVVKRATADKFNYDGLKSRELGDNKLFFCASDGYLIHPAIYRELKDKGCLATVGALKLAF